MYRLGGLQSLRRFMGGLGVGGMHWSCWGGEGECSRQQLGLGLCPCGD